MLRLVPLWDGFTSPLSWRLWGDWREWDVAQEKIPKTSGLTIPATATAPLLQLLLEAGVALTPAVEFAASAAWFPVFRYADAFAPAHGELRIVPEAADWEASWVQSLAEDLGVGVAVHLARSIMGVDHFADVLPLLRRGKLTYATPPVDPKHPWIRPDFLGELPSGEVILLEAKGVAGTRSKLTPQLAKGERQVDNVELVAQAPRKQGCERMVIGTHFCIDGKHNKSKTTTVLRDPPRPSSDRFNDPEGSDLAIRVSYAKAFQFANRPRLAWNLVAGIPVELGSLWIQTPRQLKILGPSPLGTVVMDARVADAIQSAGRGNLRPGVQRAVAGLKEEYRAGPRDELIMLSNGVGLLPPHVSGVFQELV